GLPLLQGAETQVRARRRRLGAVHALRAPRPRVRRRRARPARGPALARRPQAPARPDALHRLPARRPAAGGRGRARRPDRAAARRRGPRRAGPGDPRALLLLPGPRARRCAAARTRLCPRRPPRPRSCRLRRLTLCSALAHRLPSAVVDRLPLPHLGRLPRERVGRPLLRLGRERLGRGRVARLWRPAFPRRRRLPLRGAAVTLPTDPGHVIARRRAKGRDTFSIAAS
ncbi:hypothetical protein DFJ74DRAFT_725023, partial [Hyaloraphidium curvatum]